MRILLTGKPKSGKTSLLKRLLEQVEDKQGMAAAETLDHGQRVGFDLQGSSGRAAALARVNHQTDISVGRYFVDVASLDAFIEPLFRFKPEQLLYIDEIGQMQLYSETFQKLVQSYLNAPNDYLGTISSIYEHPFIDKTRGRKDILLCTITPENRDVLFMCLSAALKNRDIFNALHATPQMRVLSLAREYLASESYISLKKLFHNAVIYVAKNRVTEVSPNILVVQGNHDKHNVSVHENSYSCDCDFFNGRGQFTNKAGECSHIQAVKILK